MGNRSICRPCQRKAGESLCPAPLKAGNSFAASQATCTLRKSSDLSWVCLSICMLALRHLSASSQHCSLFPCQLSEHLRRFWKTYIGARMHLRLPPLTAQRLCTVRLQWAVRARPSYWSDWARVPTRQQQLVSIRFRTQVTQLTYGAHTASMASEPPGRCRVVEGARSGRH